MADRKWGAIASGATFEALATTIVFFEDPKAALFGRRGMDGGQDARSGDGTRVFQAKHHEDGSSASAIRDAKKEAAKIRDYRQPSHQRYNQWLGVTHWRLVTNAPFNPTDHQKWNNEVVPLFTAQGLKADYWECANLDALLDKHREVHRSFFENETRAFLSIPEIRDRLPLDEPFLQRPVLGEFFGRGAEISRVRDFLASKELFLVVHGTGGMGKTRLLVEAGELIASEGAWQVLWANVTSMTATGAWFEAIALDRPTLLLVDEPPDEELLQQLSEQLGGRIGPTAQWKVAVAVRSPKDPVLRFLRGPRVKPRVREFAIAALPDVAAEAMCDDLLASGALGTLSDEKRRAVARELARRFAGHPVWLTLAVHMLESRSELSMVPATAKDLADFYLDEIVRSQQQSPPEQILALLRWVALLGTVNREDDATVKRIGDASAFGDLTEVRKKLAGLVARRALIERGARTRLVELKPDVLRDHVLLSWLSADIGYGENPIIASEDGRALVSSVCEAMLAGDISAPERAILVSLARTELLLRLSGKNVPLLDEFFAGISAEIKPMSASHRLALAEVLVTIAAFRPVDTAILVRALRLSIVPDETIDGLFRTRTLGQDDVILKLAWPLFHAAMGAQTVDEQRVVLSELCALAETEAELASRLTHGLPNDGKRAAALVKRTLEGGPQFWSGFDDVAKEQAEHVLAAVSHAAPIPGKLALLKALIQTLISVERRQTWSDGNAVHFQTHAIGTGHPTWAIRATILTRIKEIIAGEATPMESCVALWHVFAAAHGDINQICTRGPEPQQQQYFEYLLEDLVWARGLLASRAVNMEELAAARKLWDWHRRFEKNAELRAASDQLEKLYTGNDLASEFEFLLSRDDWEQRGPRIEGKAAQLAVAANPEEISSFIDRAIRFTGAEKELYQFMDVAWALGAHAATHEVVRNFVLGALAHPTTSPRTDFGTIVAASWAAFLRKGETPTQAHALVVGLMKRCGSDEQRLSLVLRIYGGLPRPRGIGDLTREEYVLLRSLGPLFLDRDQGPAFIAAAAVTLHHEWPTLKPILEEVLTAIPRDQHATAFGRLVESVYWAVREADLSLVPAGLGTWLLDQLLLVPDFDDLRGNVEWHIEEILKRIGRAPVAWLPRALTTRRTLEAQECTEGVRAVSNHVRFSAYVNCIVAADVGNPVVDSAVGDLVALVDDNGTIGYHLPEILRDIDPDGLMIPAEVARRVTGLKTSEGIRCLAGIGGAYEIGSTPWRTIAKPLFESILPGDIEVRRSLFSELADRGIQSWSGTPGEVPEIFVSAVEEAKRALASEKDAAFRSFWEWRLALAEAQLRNEEERAKEDRGE
ncbi:MAG: ATP-binding protein [Verrucomicrobiaceae bacterium]|nr:MAG: ATP-binding protein [Verrucomicrobiaceae bacterium]